MTKHVLFVPQEGAYIRTQGRGLIFCENWQDARGYSSREAAERACEAVSRKHGAKAVHHAIDPDGKRRVRVIDGTGKHRFTWAFPA